jgi:hypothetical protein
LPAKFNLKFVLNHISHSQSILDYVARLKVPVIVGPIYEHPPSPKSASTPSTAFPPNSTSAASGSSSLPRIPTKRAIYPTPPVSPPASGSPTTKPSPAEIWGLADKLGSLDPGKTANVVVSNGDPLDVKTDVKMVFINGNEVPVTSRQTRLRDEYSAK